MEALGCLPATLEPKATDHVTDMVATIEQIIANGHAYAVDGDVFFDVASLPGYGRLSGRAQVSFLCSLCQKLDNYIHIPALLGQQVPNLTRCLGLVYGCTVVNSLHLVQQPVCKLICAASLV